jgi:hypothetical protein
MIPSGEGAPSDGENSAAQLLAKALVEGASPGPHAPQGDLFKGLDELEREVLPRYWESGRPSGDGSAYFNEAMKIRLKRLRKKARNESWAELIWLIGKAGAALLLFAAAFHYFF